MFPWSIPDEMVSFVWDEFNKFNAPIPSDRALDTILEDVIHYTIRHNYFPAVQGEAERRYENPGLTEPEKVAFLGPLEIKLKIQLREHITIDQIHLAVWAGLLFCWSEKGEEHVSWYEYIERRDKIFSDIKDKKQRSAS